MYSNAYKRILPIIAAASMCNSLLSNDETESKTITFEKTHMKGMSNPPYDKTKHMSRKERLKYLKKQRQKKESNKC